jgi:hypothetical protein
MQATTKIIGRLAKGRPAAKAARRAFVLVAIVIALASCAAVLVARAGAAGGGTPAAITGLASSTHPSETTWYRSTSPSFTWDPVAATNSAIAGYSIVLDQNLDTVPDAVTDRHSLDFLARAAYASGTAPAEDRVADLNGDGRQDVVVENYQSNTVSVFIGRGDGTFAAKVDYTTGAGPWSLAVIDVNADGKADIVTGNLGASTASVLLGNGNGTFAAKVDYTTGSAPECLRVGDVNADSKPDIVTTNSTANTVSVLLGNGNGTFKPKADFATSGHPTSIDLGDVNGDTKTDLVTANTTPNTVSVLMGNGDGTFKAKVDYGTGAQPYTVIVADVNRDGKLDIETVNYGASTASILLNNGNGTFKTKVDYATGSGPYALAVADLNHDGASDLVTTNHDASTVSILFGNGDGTFCAKADRATGAGPFWVALGDFNGDGYGDLATTDFTANSMSVLQGTAFLAASYSNKADGVWYFHVRAVDALGVGGPTTTRTVRIDATAPVTTQSGADAAWHDSDVNLVFSPSDPASGVASTEYKIGSGAWTEGTTVTVPATPDGSNDGPHVVSYRSTDVAGNVETAKTCTVNIVTSAPTTVVSGSDAAWHASDVTLGFSSASYGVSGTEYSTDDGATWTAGTSLIVHATAGGANDGTHTVLYRSTNGAGLTETPKSCTVKIDVGAPTTTASGADAAWHDSDVTLSFSGADAGSGVASTEYKVDGSDWATGTSVVIAAAGDGANDGTHTVLYRSTDAAGHVEDAKSCTVKIDAGAPTTTESGADAAWHYSDVTLSFSGADAGSGVASTEYKVDDADWATGTSVIVPATAGDGTHTVLYRSTDASGHVEDAKSCTVKIDADAPTTSVTGADGAWHNSDITLSFSGSDAGSGVASTEYKVDGSDWATGTSVVVPATAGDGTHTVLYRSTDALGHVEGPRSCTVKIDTAAETSSQTGADEAWHDSDVTLAFSATGGAVTEYSVDGADWTTGSSVIVAAPADGDNDGSHTVRYRSVDEAGNIETPQSCTVMIDASAPTTTATGADDSWHNSDVSLSFSGADTGSGVASTEYKVDGNDWATGESVVVPATAGDGTHTVLYRSTDALGHVEAPKSCSVKIDTHAPVTHATGFGTEWSDSDVTVAFTVADAAAPATTEYSIDGGGWTLGSDALVAAPADHSNDGLHTVAYRSTDAAGNVEATRSDTVKIATLSTNAKGVYRMHKMTRVRVLRLSWAPVDGATTYSILVNEVVVGSTSSVEDNILAATVPAAAHLGRGALVRIVAYDGAARQLAVGAKKVAAYTAP